MADIQPNVNTQDQKPSVDSQGSMDARERGRGGKAPFQKNARRQSREPRVRSEFDQKIIAVRRVARVAAGGRRFNFSVAIVLGNKKGSVGVGTGKGQDTASAIDKATRSAKKHMVKLSLNSAMSIVHPVECKYSSARVLIMPSPGRGVAAGGAVRIVLDLAGVKDVTAKIFSPSKNQLNMARAAISALSSVRSKPAIEPAVRS